jgi:hypothetical protein
MFGVDIHAAIQLRVALKLVVCLPVVLMCFDMIVGDIKGEVATMYHDCLEDVGVFASTG